MILPVFKTGERQVRPVFGAFDSHTLPPSFSNDLSAVMGLIRAPITSCDRDEISVRRVRFGDELDSPLRLFVGL